MVVDISLLPAEIKDKVYRPGADERYNTEWTKEHEEPDDPLDDENRN